MSLSLRFLLDRSVFPPILLSLSLFLFPLSLTPFPPFRRLYSRPGPRRASSFRKLRGIQEKVKRKGPRDVYE